MCIRDRFNIREGSGLIFRDKDTNRLVRNGDDRKNADPDLRIKMIFDDGSGSCTAYLNREITEKVLGRNLDSCLEFVKENFGPEALVEEIEDALLLKPLKLWKAWHDSGGTLEINFEEQLQIFRAIGYEHDKDILEMFDLAD